MCFLRDHPGSNVSAMGEPVRSLQRSSSQRSPDPPPRSESAGSAKILA
ncbi:hypothetical protein F8B43_2825 [Methylorubrum populi]|uniref:Uncharacterized protein n=1 Tax=Methylorubrum populi TaxID=223967 RepID=A0A833J5G8_9HYPH|nr:hypothetical protein F8B43_2825 [Methylorubrum populi]